MKNRKERLYTKQEAIDLGVETYRVIQALNQYLVQPTEDNFGELQLRRMSLSQVSK